MSYCVDIIWEGCDVADVLATVQCPSWNDVRGLCSVTAEADTAPLKQGQGRFLGLRIYRGNSPERESEIFYIGTREGWKLPREEPSA